MHQNRAEAGHGALTQAERNADPISNARWLRASRKRLAPEQAEFAQKRPDWASPSRLFDAFLQFLKVRLFGTFLSETDFFAPPSAD